MFMWVVCRRESREHREPLIAHRETGEKRGLVEILVMLDIRYSSALPMVNGASASVLSTCEQSASATSGAAPARAV